MPDQTFPPVLSAFLATLWGRILTILAAISLLMGIAIEAQSLITGYYAMKKTAAEADIAEANAKAATATAVYPSKIRTDRNAPDPRGPAYRDWEEK
jgi:hypothetical protein